MRRRSAPRRAHADQPGVIGRTLRRDARQQQRQAAWRSGRTRAGRQRRFGSGAQVTWHVCSCTLSMSGPALLARCARCGQVQHPASSPQCLLSPPGAGQPAAACSMHAISCTVPSPPCAHTLHSLACMRCLRLPLPAEPVPKTKRVPAGPRDGFELIPAKVETIAAIPYDIIKEGLV